MPTETDIAGGDAPSRITESLLIAGLRVDLIPDLQAVVEESTAALRHQVSWLMTFVNPGSAGVVHRHPSFAADLRQFDLVGADGIAMVKTMRWLLRRPRIARISFDSTSLAPPIFSLASQEGYPVVLCGGVPGVAEAAAASIRELYPDLKIIGVFDGFGDPVQLVFDIVKLNPRIVICGMGALHQELLLLKLRDHTWSGIGFTCGGYLDQLSSGFSYYPAWVDRLDIRFAYRFYKEPRRLWRRYALDYPRFWANARGYSVINREGKV
jgi:N-acetylglucosaminyldiphosphoundecaprenol N-acetyl-beta-D-mannosaminyltransferase